MRFINYIVLILLPLFAQSEEWNMITIRNLYYRASISKEDSEKFKATLRSIHAPNECIKGYIGASHMIEAKYVYNPSTKLTYFNDGKSMLDNAIKNQSDNIELRFLRICIQTNAPSFLGYNKQIETDKTFIISRYSRQTDLDLKNRIKEFMIQSTLCTEEEKKSFN